MRQKEFTPLESLLEPIPGENATGEDIRDDPSPASDYYSIKDTRNAARAAERNNMFDGDSNEARDLWNKVISLAPGILQNKSKDLEVASWYTEALIRHYGYHGLLYGFKLIHGLIEQYWDKLYPQPDEDGVATRVLSLAGLNGQGADGVLIAPIRNVPLTQGSDPGPFSYWKYQQALDVEKIMDEEAKADKAAKLGFSNEQVEIAVTESSDEFFINIRDDLSTAIDTYREIGRILDEYCGLDDAPSTSNIINSLEDCLGAVNHIGKEKFPAEEVPEADESSADGASDTPQTTTAAPKSTGPVQSREEAFKQIKIISEFFRKTEPHSPISYILDRAVLWGEMTLEELMKELITDGSARDSYTSLTGVNTRNEDEGE
ncbi:Uncharacterized protein ImpA [hydrothermal vent metagenome]|uniref:Uncharacterized protein ImpA n=1 Tax=hydrothermal vent metagenome TaxID=652676 RepID=A0A3B0XXV1_9ZZZZ